MQNLATTIGEQTTARYRFTLVDPDGVGIDSAQIEALTLTSYDVATGLILNSRDEQDVYQTNDVILTTALGPPLTTTVEWTLQPSDTIVVDDQWSTEMHAALFRWTWDAGTRHNAHSVMFGVENLHRPQPVP